MKPAVFFMVLLLTACGEPSPSTRTHLDPEGALSDATRPRALGQITFSLSDKTNLTCLSGRTAREVHEEVFMAESESYPVSLVPSEEPALRLVLESVDFRDDDSWDMVPGSLIPGVVPFGPLGFWWFYKDLKVETPSLTTRVRVEHGSRSLSIDVTVVRAVDTQEDLLRSALSQSSRTALEWLYPEAS